MAARGKAWQADEREHDDKAAPAAWHRRAAIGDVDRVPLHGRTSERRANGGGFDRFAKDGGARGDAEDGADLQAISEAVSTQWRAVADHIRPKVPTLATIMDEAGHDVLAFMSFPKEHRAKLHSANLIKRRTDIVGVYPNDEAIVRLVGALLFEQDDEWAVQRARCMTLKTSLRWAMIQSSACRQRHPDQAGPSRASR